MKMFIIIIVALAAGFGLAHLFVPSGGDTQSVEADQPGRQYTCGMHPEIVTNEPGYCPICEMKLTPRKDGGRAGSVTVDPTTRQSMGLVTTEVRYAKLQQQVLASGKVAFAEPRLHAVNLKIDGWVERLYVDHEGARVELGQRLLEVYSPELVAAQREFLIALEAAHSDPQLVAASRTRLANWDISEDQIQRLQETGQTTRTMTIKSPADGVVAAMKITEGDHLRPGTELYKIADLSAVWVVAHVYEQDLPFVGPGQTANVSLPGRSGERFPATVTYVAPYLDRRGQVEIRLDVDNLDYRLKPEMYAEVAISSQLEGERLVIPRSAVINSGTRRLAYVVGGDDTYESRSITTGAVGDDDLIEIVSGLSAGERVVTSGQFLLDSESRLGEALADGHAGHQHAEAVSNETGEPFEFGPDEPVATGGHDIYTCPMKEHYHVLQYGEGNCSECGMKLVPLPETDNRRVYVCPMTECGVVTDHPDKCSVCGMNLVGYRPEADDDH